MMPVHEAIPTISITPVTMTRARGGTSPAVMRMSIGWRERRGLGPRKIRGTQRGEGRGDAVHRRGIATSHARNIRWWMISTCSGHGGLGVGRGEMGHSVASARELEGVEVPKVETRKVGVVKRVDVNDVVNGVISGRSVDKVGLNEVFVRVERRVRT